MFILRIAFLVLIVFENENLWSYDHLGCRNANLLSSESISKHVGIPDIILDEKRIAFHK